jgi:adenylate kinase family enzyme
MRTLITGASGSGTTTLGRALADILKVPFLDADDYYWLPTDPPYQQKRTASLRLSMLTKDLDCARNGAIVAGSVVNWGMELEDSFSLIVFLLVPAEARVDRLRKRETALFSVVNPEFVAWPLSMTKDDCREGALQSMSVGYLRVAARSYALKATCPSTTA